MPSNVINVPNATGGGVTAYAPGYGPTPNAGATPQPAPITANLDTNPNSRTYGLNIPTPAAPPQQPAKPVTAFSSDTANQYASDNTQKLQTLKNTGLTVGQDGLARYSDSSFATAPMDAVQDPNSGMWTSGGVNYAIGPATSADPELTAIQKQISDMKTQFDATSQSMINNIKSQFENLIAKQGDNNTRAQASLDQTLLMGGSSRYAQLSSTGQSASMMSYGLQQIADLNTKEQAAVIQATQAQEAGDMKLMDSALSIAQKARDEKQAAAKALSDKLTKQSDTIKANQAQAKKDTAIQTLLSQGVTDPNQILKSLQASGNTDITAKDIADTVTNLNPNAKEIVNVLGEATKFGAPADVLKAIGSSKTLTEAYTAAGQYLQDPTSAAGMYNAYVKSAQAAGQTPVSAQSFAAQQKYLDAYNTAKGTAAGKAAGEGNSGGNLTQNSIKTKKDFPQTLKPYAKQSGNGTWYLDLSSIGAQLRGSLINQAGDIPVITDKNQAADLVNIKDAYGKLNTIATAMKDMTSSSALSRDLGGAGLSALSALAQTDPKKAAAQALNDSALDFLKAISGVQGFRGNQTAIQQIKDSLPKITDTQDVAAQKLSYIAQQIADREEATVGGRGTTDVTSFVIRSEDQAKNALVDVAKKDSGVSDQITQVLGENNPDSGQPYTYLEAAQILGIDIPGINPHGPFDVTPGLTR